MIIVLPMRRPGFSSSSKFLDRALSSLNILTKTINAKLKIVRNGIGSPYFTPGEFQKFSSAWQNWGSERAMYSHEFRGLILFLK